MPAADRIFENNCAEISPVTGEAFWQKLEPLLEGLPDGPLIAAVSGGADSMALLYLLEASADKHQRDILAVTIDHDLREQSASEAAAVASYCGVRNIPHRIVVWHGPKPKSAMQEKARQQRYKRLLCVAGEEGAAAILTGHSASDQAETFLARLARGSGINGLSAIAEHRQMAAGPAAPIPVLRPLLSFGRQQIRASCKVHNIPFHDDSSNEDPKYERVRHRAVLSALAAQDILHEQALCRSAARLQRQQSLLDASVAGLFANLGGAFHPQGAISLPRGGLLAAPAALAEALLEKAAQAVSGAAMAGDSGAGPALLAAVKQQQNMTQSGALVMVKADTIWLLREPAGVLGRADGTPGLAPMKIIVEEKLIWDGRFILTPRREGLLAPIGTKSEMIKGVGALGGALLASLPAIWDGNNVIAVPKLVKNMKEVAKLPWIEGMTDLNMVSLVPERLLQRVVRF